jgi:hypothetical protein
VIAFLAALPDEAKQSDDLEALIGGLDDVQLAELNAIVNPPRQRPATRKRLYPAELGQRWIFERVIALGWTPERFAEFEDIRLREGPGRSAHKPERFGKKYQWIALRELLARIADNYHMAGEWSGEERRYQGPWQFYGRDIDPTLPPPPRYRDDEDVERVGPTFEDDPPGAWWDPGGPRYRATDTPPSADWASSAEDVVAFEDLVRRTDDSGAKWIALQAYYNWNEERVGRETPRGRARRDMWTHIFSWLIPAPEASGLVKDLKSRSFMGRWMPEAGEITNDAYLGEMPWAAAASEYPPGWDAVRPERDAEPGYEVLPAWEGYMWEGGSLDCSLQESIHAAVPTRLLYDSQQPAWVAGTKSWRDETGTIVVRHVGGDGEHSALLVRETWLKAALKRGGWTLVIGRLGEKMLFDDRASGRVIGERLEINGVASYGLSAFKIAAETTATKG